MKYVHELKKLMQSEETSTFEYIARFFEKVHREVNPKIKASCFGEGIEKMQKKYGYYYWNSNWMFHLGYAQALQDYNIKGTKQYDLDLLELQQDCKNIVLFPEKEIV